MAPACRRTLGAEQADFTIRRRACDQRLLPLVLERDPGVVRSKCRSDQLACGVLPQADTSARRIRRRRRRSPPPADRSARRRPEPRPRANGNSQVTRRPTASAAPSVRRCRATADDPAFRPGRLEPRQPCTDPPSPAGPAAVQTDEFNGIADRRRMLVTAAKQRDFRQRGVPPRPPEAKMLAIEALIGIIFQGGTRKNRETAIMTRPPIDPARADDEPQGAARRSQSHAGSPEPLQQDCCRPKFDIKSCAL